MGPGSRSDQPISLGFLPQLGTSQTQSGPSTATTSPVEPPTANASRLPFPNTSSQKNMPSVSPIARLANSSPSHEFPASAAGGSGTARLYSKRAREIQAQEGVTPPQLWAPSPSGTSTPLHETIPESPNGGNFPDFEPTAAAAVAAANDANESAGPRRVRAGTLPSSFSSAVTINGLGPPPPPGLPITSRPTPSSSPFRLGLASTTDPKFVPTSSAAAKSALLSRLRAGSTPQRVNLLGAIPSPFGPSIFSTGWPGGPDRSVSLQSLPSASTQPLISSQPPISKDNILMDSDVKTLDYLGLVDTPQPNINRATFAPSDVELLLEEQRASNAGGFGAFNKNSTRFRSYSVNAKELYADDGLEDDIPDPYEASYLNSMGPTATDANASATAFAVHEAVRQHNLEVQAFASLASASRPRARTAGILDSPSTRLLRTYMPTSSKLDTSVSAADLNVPDDPEYLGLAEAVRGLQMNGQSLGDLGNDEAGSEGPTRALWLGNIPSSTTVSSLNAIFGNYGPIESARVLTHKNCGFVNYDSIDSAVLARSQLNNKEIFPGAGPIRIGHAKVPSASATPGHTGSAPSPSPETAAASRSHLNAGSEAHNNQRASNGRSADDVSSHPALAIVTPQLQDHRDDMIRIITELGAAEDERARIAVMIERSIEYDKYESDVPPIAEPSHNRIHDAPKLREIRKRIDNNSFSIPEIEEVAMGMLDEVAELSSDYLGNTVVQKLFETCSEEVKEAMLAEIAPHMAEIGIHKNGTWAAQKIIDVSRSQPLMSMVVSSLRRYGVALFLDQFGNYVMQGCLRYQSPLNDFIFEVMLSRLWELAQGRFGARAMRACLESHYSTKDQQRAVAAAIALHGVQLSTNANGALLLTWFLDTCTFPRRRSVLAPRLVPHLVHLCTHKVAYLTVLKIINQRNEPEARDEILNALFFSSNDQVLEDILADQTCGATLIFKVLTTPFFEENIRADVVQNIRNVLTRIKAQPNQGYKRLMDEVGLSTRNGGGGGGSSSSGAGGGGGPGGREVPDGPRSGSRGVVAASHPHPHQAFDAPMNRHYAQVMPMLSYDQAMNLQRPPSVDSVGMEPFPTVSGLNAPQMYNGPGNGSNGRFMPAPSQYQQAVLSNVGRQPQFYPSLGPGGMNPPGTPGLGHYQSPQPSLGPAPIGPGYAPHPSFGPPPMMNQMFGYPMPFVPQQQQHAPAQAAGVGRRGRF